MTDHRYHNFIREYPKKCRAAQANFAKNDKEDWREAQRIYKTTIDNWWCGCPSFTKSPNHICKHHIRLYIGPEGLESNKPRTPFYGEVWRQTMSPVLWIYG